MSNQPSRPQPYKARLEDRHHFNDKYIQLDFELVEPHRLDFVAGQYASIRVDEHGTRRSYSFASRPDINHGFNLLLDILPEGLGSQYLFNLEPGQEVDLLAPLGQFVINQEAGEDQLVLIGTGSGIAPLYSMVLDQLQVRQDSRPIMLYWGMRHAHDLFWMDEFEELVENFANFSFYPVLSRPEEGWTLSRGHVTDLIKVHDFSPAAGFYLCGNSGMITDVSATLQAKQVAPERIHHEKFY